MAYSSSLDTAAFRALAAVRSIYDIASEGTFTVVSDNIRRNHSVTARKQLQDAMDALLEFEATLPAPVAPDVAETVS